MHYLIQSYLDDSADAFPGKTAISCGNSAISYRDLNISANRLANALIQSGVKRQDRVCICLKRSIESIAAMTAILKADAVYVPVDIKSPVWRWEQIIADCRPSAIICDGNTVKTIIRLESAVIGNAAVICLDDAGNLHSKRVIFQKEIDSHDSVSPVYRNIDTDLAYILYTSGSTGKPKGVMISHSNINNYIEWAVNYFKIFSENTILSTAPFHFDMSTFDIYCALKTGAKLCLALDMDLLFPEKLVCLAEKQKATIWKGIASLLMYLARAKAISPQRLKDMKKIIFSGEVLPTKYIVKWMETFPDKQFFNVYGPTETTGISTYYPVKTIPKDISVPLPIGYACANTEVLILTEEGRSAGVGELGELFIRGSGVSRGYWNDPEKTRKAFVPNPLTDINPDTVYRTGDLVRWGADGVIEFAGRKDLQVKYMGYRIELFEIENALLSIEGVTDAAVSLNDSPESDLKELVAFFESESWVPHEVIKAEMKTKVPDYMVPKRFIPVSQLPRNDRGKIDRSALGDILVN